MKIQILIYDGFGELDAIAVDVEQRLEYQRRDTVWRMPL